MDTIRINVQTSSGERPYRVKNPSTVGSLFGSSGFVQDNMIPENATPTLNGSSAKMTDEVMASDTVGYELKESGKGTK